VLERIAAWQSDDADARAATLEREFESSMQAMMAAAIALDSFYLALRDKTSIPTVHRVEPEGRLRVRLDAFAEPSANGRYLREADGWSRRQDAVRSKRGPRLSPFPLSG
jgi:hypothetical protein